MLLDAKNHSLTPYLQGAQNKRIDALLGTVSVGPDKSIRHSAFQWVLFLATPQMDPSVTMANALLLVCVISPGAGCNSTGYPLLGSKLLD